MQEQRTSVLPLPQAAAAASWLQAVLSQETLELVKVWTNQTAQEVVPSHQYGIKHESKEAWLSDDISSPRRPTSSLYLALGGTNLIKINEAAVFTPV